MDNADSLKKKIDELEIQIVKEREAHELNLSKIKTENYEALEASEIHGNIWKDIDYNRCSIQVGYKF